MLPKFLFPSSTHLESAKNPFFGDNKNKPLVSHDQNKLMIICLRHSI